MSTELIVLGGLLNCKYKTGRSFNSYVYSIRLAIRFNISVICSIMGGYDK